MYLMPLHWRTKISAHTPIYEPLQHIAIDALINETAALLELFNNVALTLGSYAQLNSISQMNSYDFDVPTSKWQPILSESCNDLEKSLANFKPNSYSQRTVCASDIVEQN